MEAIFTLKISKQDRDKLVRAVEATADEYRHAAEQVLSRYLSSGFQKDAEDYDRLACALKNLVDRAELNEQVSRWLGLGLRIDAIKAVRTATSMGLKEAKEYVDNFTTAPDYGQGII